VCNFVRELSLLSNKHQTKSYLFTKDGYISKSSEIETNSRPNPKQLKLIATFHSEFQAMEKDQASVVPQE